MILSQAFQWAHWGSVMHICISNLTITGSDNGLSPGWHQAITWTKAGILLIGPLGNSNRNSFKKMPLKMSSGKWRPFYLGLKVLMAAQLSFQFKCESYGFCKTAISISQRANTVKFAQIRHRSDTFGIQHIHIRSTSNQYLSNGFCYLEVLDDDCIYKAPYRSPTHLDIIYPDELEIGKEISKYSLHLELHIMCRTKPSIIRSVNTYFIHHSSHNEITPYRR